MVEVRGSSVRLGIEAPEGVIIHRDEVLARIVEQNRKALASPGETVKRLLRVLPTPHPEKGK